MQRSSEQNFILSLLAGDPGAVSRHCLESLDWEYIVLQCEEHKIIPVVYKPLVALEPDLVPKKALQSMQSRYKAVAALNFARSGQLIKIVNALKKGSVPVIAYKGMVLAELAYKDTTLRQFGDIDLFVRRKDFAKAKEILVDLGLRPAWELDKSQENAVLKYYYEYPFHFGETDTLVEVHWEFVESFFAFDYEFNQVWDRTIEVELYGTKITTLSPEDYLVVLCSHGSKHFWKRISWICDVAKLIENTSIDWDIVVRRAKRYGCVRMVGIGVYLANAVCKVSVPGEIAILIRKDRAIERLGERFLTNMFDEDREPSEWTAMARTHLEMRERSGTKLKYAFRLLSTKVVDSLFLPMGRPR